MFFSWRDLALLARLAHLAMRSMFGCGKVLESHISIRIKLTVRYHCTANPPRLPDNAYVQEKHVVIVVRSLVRSVMSLRALFFFAHRPLTNLRRRSYVNPKHQATGKRLDADRSTPQSTKMATDCNFPSTLRHPAPTRPSRGQPSPYLPTLNAHCAAAPMINSPPSWDKQPFSLPIGLRWCITSRDLKPPRQLGPQASTRGRSARRGGLLRSAKELVPLCTGLTYRSLLKSMAPNLLKFIPYVVPTQSSSSEAVSEPPPKRLRGRPKGSKNKLKKESSTAPGRAAARGGSPLPSTSLSMSHTTQPPFAINNFGQNEESQSSVEQPVGTSADTAAPTRRALPGAARRDVNAQTGLGTSMHIDSTLPSAAQCDSEIQHHVRAQNDAVPAFANMAVRTDMAFDNAVHPAVDAQEDNLAANRALDGAVHPEVNVLADAPVTAVPSTLNGAVHPEVNMSADAPVTAVQSVSRRRGVIERARVQPNAAPSAVSAPISPSTSHMSDARTLGFITDIENEDDLTSFLSGGIGEENDEGGEANGNKKAPGPDARVPFPEWFQKRVNTLLEELKDDLMSPDKQSRHYKNGQFWIHAKSIWSSLRGTALKPTDLFTPDFFLWDPLRPCSGASGRAIPIASAVGRADA
ncbi:hypothetical protein C8F04DRAFT_1239130 [Mycena alexandri]|uniref:Uncharacterized protein n=1 Tax=Mycena alexandri TaxID=1745969 RepID=A0AAD6SCR9_9AGAR|nr:hypothetical protein C8F04DRAFT_1239130 [Mycena alexandri]